MADDRQAALNAIDLKGNIVLKEFGDTALLFRPQNNYEPFVVAYGYDKAAGDSEGLLRALAGWVTEH